MHHVHICILTFVVSRLLPTHPTQTLHLVRTPARTSRARVYSCIRHSSGTPDYRTLAETSPMPYVCVTIFRREDLATSLFSGPVATDAETSSWESSGCKGYLRASEKAAGAECPSRPRIAAHEGGPHQA